MIRFLLGTFFTIFFLYALATQIHSAELVNQLSELDYGWTLLAILFFIIGYSARIERWRVMLVRDNPIISWKDCAGPLLASVAANNVLPFRVGDLLRGFNFNKRLGIRVGVSIASLFVERILDLAVILTIFGLSVSVFSQEITGLLGVGGGLILLITIFVFMGLLIPGLIKPFINLIIYITVTYLSLALSKKISRQVKISFAYIQYLSKSKSMFLLLGWSFIAWIAEGLFFLFIAIAIPKVDYAFGALCAMVVGTLSTIIPSAPGYIGTFHYFTANAMSFSGNEISISIFYAFIVHILMWMLTTSIGGIYFLVMSINSRKANVG